jgi:chemotaxis protein histidine kinase CheA/ActR/RegA family two-component response regulator
MNEIARDTDDWGDDFDGFDALDLESDADAADWDLREDESDLDDELQAPTAAEIQTLMQQLAGQPTTLQPATACQVPVSMVPVSMATLRSAADDVAETRDGVADVSIASLDPELREAFMDDATNCLASIERALLSLETDPHAAAPRHQICRELHTLKGASGSVGLSRLATQLHQLEDLLQSDQAASRATDIDHLLSRVDWIRGQLGGNTRQAADMVDQGTPQSPPAEGPSFFADDSDDDESVRVKSSQLNRLMDMLAQLVMLRNRRQCELSDLQAIHQELIGSAAKMRLLSNDTDLQTESGSSLQLSEVANDVFELAQQVRDCARPISDGNDCVSQFIRDFRQELIELRRTPIAGLFRRLQRVVRDTARQEQKEVRLQMIGADAGIERSIQQRLYEPLLHIVRNSICHGIESSAVRQQQQKSGWGTISLEAKSGPDLFVIEIRDDGQGLNYDAIRRRAIESGLIQSNQQVSRHDLSQLIFQPGFSTRQTVDQNAGRGVGMDVVANTLARMRGWLEVNSEPGRGTSIKLSFPLPSVIQHALVFRAGNQLFAVPMQAVQATGTALHGNAGVAFTDLIAADTPDAASPAVAGSDPDQHIVIAAETSAAEGRQGSPRTRVGWLVDEIVGPEELVVRPLPPLLKNHPYCYGATLSAGGATVLLLDARQIIEFGRERAGRFPDTGAATLRMPTQATTELPRVLVVDDSISARKRVVRSLRRYRVEIVEANDGRQALEILKHESFAAIFSDMEMPHVSGMELLAEIQSRPRQTVPPVVIISSRYEPEFTDRATELGANNYLIKPLADEALDAAIAGIPTLQHLISNNLTAPLFCPPVLDPCCGDVQ